jgi:hypothetical protein
MAENERLWALIVGDFVERGDMVGIELHYFVDTDDEKVIPVFTSHERLEDYVRTDLNTPEGHLDMMEGGDLTRARALSEGRFKGVLMDVNDIAELAVEMEADWLMRDPRPGEEQDVWRVPK